MNNDIDLNKHEGESAKLDRDLLVVQQGDSNEVKSANLKYIAGIDLAKEDLDNSVKAISINNFVYWQKLDSCGLENEFMNKLSNKISPAGAKKLSKTNEDYIEKVYSDKKITVEMIEKIIKQKNFSRLEFNIIPLNKKSSRRTR